MRRQEGQTLIEILVALTATAVITAGAIVVVTYVLNKAQFIKNQNLATYYAQQGMEIVRTIRDSSITTFASKNFVHYCLSEGSTVLIKRIGPACPQNVGIFVREITINQGSTDCAPAGNAKIKVQVKWSDNICPGSKPFCHQVELISCFTDINSVGAP